MSGTERVCRGCRQSKVLSEYYLDKRRGTNGTLLDITWDMRAVLRDATTPATGGLA